MDLTLDMKGVKIAQRSPIFQGIMEDNGLANMWELLKKQPNGEEGELLINGRANIFQTADNRYIIRVRWRSAGWCFYAYSSQDPCAIEQGDKVFC